MKRIILLILALVLTFASAGTVSVTARHLSAPRHINALSVNVALDISTQGKATIAVRCMGSNELIPAQTITYLERREDVSWVRVDNGQMDNEWVYTSTAYNLNEVYTLEVTQPGMYRAVTIFKLGDTTIERFVRTDRMFFEES